ncbi:MAG: aspartate--tRNA ligase [Solirubrobacteraceae bacterium]
MRRAPSANRYRDTWAGEPRASRAGEQLRVAGWVHRRRDHGGLIFIDLRDRSGILQLVFHPQTSGAAFAAAERLRSEHVLSASGLLVEREAGNVNPNLPTGEVELQVTGMDVLAQAETPPFPVDEDGPVDENTRLHHRVLDLRREHMRDNIVLRDAITREMRTVLSDADFLEIETPMLTRSTPEGARDFLVPARLQPGSWYALPQSPQLFKQLLMIGGFERYFQIVRCFRDEDLRADRQPEFTQLDIEMSFVEEEDVTALMETLMARVFAIGGFREVLALPWPRMPYDEASVRYGTDRPDLRFGLEIHDLSTRWRRPSSRSSARCSTPAGSCAASTSVRARRRAAARRAHRDGPAQRRQGARVVSVQPAGRGARRSRSSWPTARCRPSSSRPRRLRGRPAACRR